MSEANYQSIACANCFKKEELLAAKDLKIKEREKMLDEYADLEIKLNKEIEEQARLLGISGSKEAKLLAELSLLRQKSEKLVQALEWYASDESEQGNKARETLNEWREP